MLTTTVGRVRVAGMVEGISFLVLLGVAMPLKYFAGMPEAVKIVGWVHGLLFMAFVAFLLVAHGEKRWPLSFTGLVFLAALLPFGPFIIDRRLKQETQS
jgi:integral membrane protein